MTIRGETQKVMAIRHQSVESVLGRDDTIKNRMFGSLVSLEERNNVSHFGRSSIVSVVIFAF